jgi:hypothetical protein
MRVIRECARDSIPERLESSEELFSADQLLVTTLSVATYFCEKLFGRFIVRVNALADAREVLKVPIGDPFAEPSLNVSHFRVHLVEKGKALVGNRVDRHASVLIALGAPNEAPINKLVDEARNVR